MPMPVRPGLTDHAPITHVRDAATRTRRRRLLTCWLLLLLVGPDQVRSSHPGRNGTQCRASRLKCVRVLGKNVRQLG